MAANRTRKNLSPAIRAFVALAFLCASRTAAAQSTPIPAVHTEQYAVITGSDTATFEMVTTCADRLIAEVDAAKSQAYITYEMFLGSDGYPTSLNEAVWRGKVGPSIPPTQIVRTVVRQDSIITDVSLASSAQTQRHAVQPHSFPFISGYVAIMTQLLRLFQASNTPQVHLFWIATRGHTSEARLVKRTADSVVIMMDTVAVAARISQGGVLESVSFDGGKSRIVRLSAANPPHIDERCAARPTDRP